MSIKKKIDMELDFIYNSNQIKEREALGYANSLGNHKINEIDIYKNPLTERQLADLAKKLDIEVHSLLNTESEIYQDEIKGGDYTDQDILKMVKENTTLLKTPILVSQTRGQFINSAFDLNKIDMAFNSFIESMSNKDEK